MTLRFVLVCSLLSAALISFASGSQAQAAGTWQWPVAGPVIRGYDPLRDAVQYGEELIARLRALVAEYDSSK